MQLERKLQPRPILPRLHPPRTPWRDLLHRLSLVGGGLIRVDGEIHVAKNGTTAALIDTLMANGPTYLSVKKEVYS